MLYIKGKNKKRVCNNLWYIY